MNKSPLNIRPSIGTAKEAFHALPRGIWALGFVSMFMDMSSELIYSLLPAFMVTVLGASMTAVGIIEGASEATAAIIKVFSGAISDYMGRRKLLAGIGYALAAATKPIFPLANTIGWVFAARFIDRIGKGIRGAPRDALVADIAPIEIRGKAYGLRQSLDSVGALVGPLAAMALMAAFANNIRTVLWFSIAPALIAVTVLVLGVHETNRGQSNGAKQRVLTFTAARQLPLRYWFIVILGAVCNLARFSEAFLVLRAQDVGLSLGYIPLVLIVMNFVYSATAYPAGAAADRFSQRRMLIVGLVTLIGADIILAAAASPLTALVGAGLWGMHMGLSQGLFAKLVADNCPSELHGSAFGVFNLISGAALLLASLVAGTLWNAFGAPLTFLTGGAFALIALLGLIAF